MSNPKRSLNRFVHWQSLLDELGAPAQHDYLPARTLCPLCRDAVMTIYEDLVCGGQWHCCPGCRSYGDLIQLASRAWQLDTHATCHKLGERLGSEFDRSEIKNYIRQHLNYRRRLVNLVVASRKRMRTSSGELNRLTNQFNLRSDVPANRWMQGPGRLFGGMDTPAIERAFAPGSMEHAKGRHPCNPSGNAIFRGGEWRDALVLPYTDLPGRICGFLLVGRDGREPEDFVYRRANIGPPGNQYRAAGVDVGLAMHPQVLAASAEWEHRIVLTSMPMTGLALQARNFEQSLYPLPLAIWTDAFGGVTKNPMKRGVSSTNAWQYLGNLKPIFWMPEFCAATIKQAIAIDALVSTVGPRTLNERTLKEYIWRYTPRDLTKHIMDSAKDWPTALSRSLSNMNNSAVKRAVERMQLAGIDVEIEIERCADQVRRRVKAALGTDGQRVTTVDRGIVVVERAGKWYERHGSFAEDYLIADGVVRIDQVLARGPQNKSYARGRIIFNKQTIKFCEPMERIEKEGFEWMQEAIMSEGIGFMRYSFEHGRRLRDIAIAFEMPEFEFAITSVGWNDRHKQFAFPNFSIEQWGEIVKPKNLLLDADAPAGNLVEPDAFLSPDEMPCVGVENETSSLLWAVLSCMIANITAPPCHKPRAGIALCGEGAQLVGRAVAEAIGCQILELSTARDVRHAIDVEMAHEWPLFAMQGSRLQKRFCRELLCAREAERNVVVDVGWADACLLALDGRWHVIEARKASELDQDLKSNVASFLVAYLQDLRRRRFVLGEWSKLSDCHAENVLADIARIVRDQGGNAAPVLAAAKLMRPARHGGHATALADLTAQRLRTGKLRIDDVDGHSDRLSILRLAEEDAFRFPHALLPKLAGNAALDTPRPERVTAVLDNAGVLLDRAPGSWVIKSEWLQG